MRPTKCHFHRTCLPRLLHSAEFQTSTRIYRSSSETQGTGATTFLPFSRITIYSGLKAGFPILDRGLSEFYFSSWIFHRGLFARETRAAVAAVDLQNAIDWKPGRIVKIFARPRSGLENRRFDVVAASQQQRANFFSTWTFFDRNAIKNMDESFSISQRQNDSRWFCLTSTPVKWFYTFLNKDPRKSTVRFWRQRNQAYISRVVAWNVACSFAI